MGIKFIKGTEEASSIIECNEFIETDDSSIFDALLSGNNNVYPFNKPERTTASGNKYNHYEVYAGHLEEIKTSDKIIIDPKGSSRPVKAALFREVPDVTGEESEE